VHWARKGSNPNTILFCSTGQRSGTAEHHLRWGLTVLGCDATYVSSFVVLRLWPCSECSLYSSGNFPGVWRLKADVSGLNVGPIVLVATFRDSMSVPSSWCRRFGTLCLSHRLMLAVYWRFGTPYMSHLEGQIVIEDPVRWAR